MRILKLNAGISLIETVVALLILSVMGIAIVGVTLQINGASTSAFLRNQAATYAEQALEEARGYYQTNRFQSTFGKVCSPGCYSDGQLGTCGVGPTTCISGATPCTTGTPIPGNTAFRRSVQVSQVSSSQIKITAKIAWSDRGKCLTTALDTYFFNY